MQPTPARPDVQRRWRRQDAVLLVLASSLGLWLGFGAPTTSPVAPAPPAAQAVAP